MAVRTVALLVSTLDPGSGWGGATPEPSAVGSAEDAGYDAKVIAKWDVVPYTSFTGLFQVGIPAFHINGIDRVEFAVDGGDFVSVADMRLNPDSGVWEYCATLDSAKFAATGIVEVRAIAYPLTAGEPRLLPSLYLVCRKTAGGTGIYTRYYAYVHDGTGNNDTGVVSATAATAAANPYADEYAAAVAIKSTRNSNHSANNCDGAIIRFARTTHTAVGGANTHTCTNEWLTWEPVTTCTITGSSAVFKCHKLKLRDLTFSGHNVIVQDTLEASATLWVSGECVLDGGGAGFPIGYHDLGHYYTGDSSGAPVEITDVGSTVATPVGQLCRNIYLHDLENDAFQNVTFIINAVVDEITGTYLGTHSDILQIFGASEANGIDSNMIVYGMRATNAHYESFSMSTDSGLAYGDQAQGQAFVNVYVGDCAGSSGEGDVPASQPASYMGHGVNHLIVWNCTFDSKSFYFFASEGHKPLITNFSAIGNIFRELGSGNGGADDDDIDFSLWDSNWFRTAAAFGVIVNPGTNAHVGNPELSSDGRPTTLSACADGCPLRLVPIDADGRRRSTPTSCGAYRA